MLFSASCLLLTTSALVRDVSAAAIEKRVTYASNVGKRGLSYNTPSYTNMYSQAKSGSSVSWAYNWGQSAGGAINSALQYVPMLWSDTSSLTSTWSSAAEAAIAAGSTELFSFNEPDLCVPGSACMSINDSVTAYKEYMMPFAGKALLGAPAVTNGAGTPEDPMGLLWLQYFMGNCTCCQFDFINIHWYSNVYAGVNYLEEQVEAARAIAGGRPIWVTEFGLDAPYTSTELTSFLESAMSYLDSQPDVYRYAYFMDAENALENAAGTGRSALGATYDTYTNKNAVHPVVKAAVASVCTSSATTTAKAAVAVKATTTKKVTTTTKKVTTTAKATTTKKA